MLLFNKSLLDTRLMPSMRSESLVTIYKMFHFVYHLKKKRKFLKSLLGKQDVF